MNNILGMYQQLMQDPMSLLKSRFNIPAGMAVNNPNAILQHLLNSGQISQAQVNQAMEMRNSPMIQSLLGSVHRP